MPVGSESCSALLRSSAFRRILLLLRQAPCQFGSGGPLASGGSSVRGGAMLPLSYKPQESSESWVNRLPSLWSDLAVSGTQLLRQHVARYSRAAITETLTWDTQKSDEGPSCVSTMLALSQQGHDCFTTRLRSCAATLRSQARLLIVRGSGGRRFEMSGPPHRAGVPRPP
jgi:hypothetical protein